MERCVGQGRKNLAPVLGSCPKQWSPASGEMSRNLLKKNAAAGVCFPAEQGWLPEMDDKRGLRGTDIIGEDMTRLPPFQNGKRIRRIAVYLVLCNERQDALIVGWVKFNHQA